MSCKEVLVGLFWVFIVLVSYVGGWTLVLEGVEKRMLYKVVCGLVVCLVTYLFGKHGLAAILK